MNMWILLLCAAVFSSDVKTAQKGIKKLSDKTTKIKPYTPRTSVCSKILKVGGTILVCGLIYGTACSAFDPTTAGEDVGYRICYPVASAWTVGNPWKNWVARGEQEIEKKTFGTGEGDHEDIKKSFGENGLRVVNKQPINPDFMKHMVGEHGGEELDLNVASTESSGEEYKQSDKKVDFRRLSNKAFRSNSENMKQ